MATYRKVTVESLQKAGNLSKVDAEKMFANMGARKTGEVAWVIKSATPEDIAKVRAAFPALKITRRYQPAAEEPSKK